jgi:hypothetical protein
MRTSAALFETQAASGGRTQMSSREQAVDARFAGNLVRHRILASCLGVTPGLPHDLSALW